MRTKNRKPFKFISIPGAVLLLSVLSLPISPAFPAATIAGRNVAIGTVEEQPVGSGGEYRYPCEKDLIEVVFIYGSKVRLRGGNLVDEEGKSVAGLDGVLKNLPGSTWQRLCDVPEETLDRLQEKGEARTGKPVSNLNNIYRLRIPEDNDAWEVSRRLEKLDGVELARPVSLPVPPPVPNYQPNQGYLKPASSTPTGINAEYAWTKTGGTGAGITVCDIEGGWTYNHVDLTKLVGSQINTNCALSDTDHGTAVAGELIANDNGWGVKGICYGATMKTCCTEYGSPSSWNPGGAIAVAAATLQAGDVILLEMQWWWRWNPGGYYDYIPIEWYLVEYPVTQQTNNSVYAAIVNAVSNGIHVVEAAANGYFNLDSLTWLADSGAIIVGAGGAYTGGGWPAGDLERLSFSDYGSRVNVQGWGEDVYTTGYGDLYSAGGVNYYYTDDFSGTSSASPIVAGAVACCLGYWTGGLGQPKNSLTPSQMRTLLISTGTPQVSPGTGHIGPRPDLLAAFQYLESIAPSSSGYRVLGGGDYNNDSYDDIAIFRPSSGLWSIRGITRVYYGSASDIPVPGDYNNDSYDNIAIFRPSSGLWSIRGITRVYYGSSSDMPVPGDYNGDGKCDFGIFRSSSGLWAVRYITRAYYGSSSDLPVPGDYNDNGGADIAVFRQSSGLWSVKGFTRLYFGGSDDIPVPMWFQGTRHYDPAIYRPSCGLWAQRGKTRVYFGSSSDQPVPSDMDDTYGDDFVIFRESSGLWAIRNYSRVYYGTSGDIPVTR